MKEFVLTASYEDGVSLAWSFNFKTKYEVLDCMLRNYDKFKSLMEEKLNGGMFEITRQQLRKICIESYVYTDMWPIIELHPIDI